MLCNALALVINFEAKWMNDLEINMVFVWNWLWRIVRVVGGATYDSIDNDDREKREERKLVLRREEKGR